MTITAAADGSALGNPGPAGWAWYVDDHCWAAGGWSHATNNVGELQAVLELLRATAHLDEELLILCDSQYVINSLTKWMPGWKRKGWRKSDGKPVLNVELMQELDAALTGRRYRFEWVKGHSQHPLNEAADDRARAAATAFQRGTTVPSGPGWTGALAAAPTPPALDTAHSAVERENADAPPVTAEAGDWLFSFDELEDEPAALLSGGTELTVVLDAAEHARLLERARREGRSPEDILRAGI